MYYRVVVLSSFGILATAFYNSITKLPKNRNISMKYEPFSTNSNLKSSIVSSVLLLQKIGLGGAFLSLASVAYAEPPTEVVETSTSVGDTFITTQSGLQYYDVKVGDGATPLPGDTVRVHYTGWLDGFESEKKFDSSYDRRSPLVFKVGVRQVIAGWDEALLTDLKVGGKRKVIIPATLGYGKRGAGGVIPPDATLYFTMELVGIGAR